MKTYPFIGRNKELDNLEGLLEKKIASLVVIKGRRRIGKSRLIEEFARNKRYYSFTGLPPTRKTTARAQRNEFARQLGEQFGLPGLKADDWGNLFTLLASKTAHGRVIIILDEISWMGSKDPDFLGKLKIAWDTQFKANPKLILILCGSISSWIEENIIKSTGFFGRIALKLNLEELSLSECNQLLTQIGFRGSPLERFTILSVTGGIPWYIELMDPRLSAYENIKKLCYEPNGILVDEFKQIFHDLFGRRGSIYQRIVEKLATGSAEYAEIAEATHYSSGGPLSDYLEDLVMSGFVSRDSTWQLKTHEESKLNEYRLSDNYLRFYLKYIKPRVKKIKAGLYSDIAINTLPGWDSILALQFENIVIRNKKLIQQELHINPEEIVMDNPFFQRKTSSQKGCQIDYLIQTKLNNLFVCEIKFSRRPITSEVIQEVKQKIDNLSRPKGFACIPILIYVGEVSDELINCNYFAKTIDFTKFLTEV